MFFQDWIVLNDGLAGVTNYIHLLGSGHMSDYMFYWRNLYIHSQQGWEAFNSLLKTFFFRRTAHGGAGNSGRSANSRLIPLARWLQRWLLWMLGYTEEDIMQIAKTLPHYDIDAEGENGNTDEDVVSNYIVHD